MCTRLHQRLSSQDYIKFTLVGLALFVMLAGCGIRSTRLHPVATNGGNWPTTGGSLSSRGVVHTAAPLAIEVRLWERKTGGVATSEPVVHNGLVYHSGLDRRAEVFDALTGDRQFRDRYDGPVTGIVAGDSSFVLVTDQKERKLYAYSNDPVEEQWSIDIPTSGAAPRVLDDGSIIVSGLHGQLIRVAPDGEVVWNVQTTGEIEAPPAIADSICVVATGRHVSARRLSDGTQIWAHQTSGAVMATPAIDNNIFVGSTDSLLYSLDLQTGRMDWFFATSGQLLTTPAVGDSVVYLAANDRKVYAINKRTGKMIWSYDTGGPANQSPALAGNTLVVATATGKLVILNATTGAVLREFKLSAPAATPPVIANNRVYVSDTRRRLYCFGPKE